MTFTIPNLLSIFRMGLVPLFIIAVIDGDALKALLLFTVAGITDALDGFIARFWNQQSLLGTYIDPIADKLLLTSAYVVLAIPRLNPEMTIPIWVTVLVIARDVLIVVMAGALFLATGIRSFPPAMLGKVTTAAQVTTVFMVLVTALWPTLPELVWGTHIAIYATAALTVASGLNYVRLANSMAGTRSVEKGGDETGE
ncbi:MAG: CDP-alcohol phosphatidyltransferase family protein [Acidobacteriota bacterium]